MPDSTSNNDHKEYGELVATVKAQTKAIEKLEQSFSELIHRHEFETRMTGLESKTDRNYSMLDHRIDNNSRKIEGITKKQTEMISTASVSTNKIANTERLMWFGASIIVAIITAYVKGVI